MTGWLDRPLLDLAAVDLDSPGPVRYLLHQRFRYDYDRPAYDVHQRLVAVPRVRHGPLRRQAHLVSVSVPGCPGPRSTARADRDGNLVVRVRLPVVEESVEFTAAAVLERVGRPGDVPLPAAALTDARHLRPTRLTRPDAALREDHIPMPLGVTHAALIREHGDEDTRIVKNVREFLREPPGILAAIAVVVIAAAYPVERAGVQDITPLIDDGAIAAPVH